MIEDYVKKVEDDLKDCAEAINKNYCNIQVYGKSYIRNLIVLRELKMFKPGREFAQQLRRRMGERFEGEFSEIIAAARKDALQRIEEILQTQQNEKDIIQSNQAVSAEQNRRTGDPGLYVKLSNEFNRSAVWVQKAAKDQGGLHSDELDIAILRMARECKKLKKIILRDVRRFEKR